MEPELVVDAGADVGEGSVWHQNKVWWGDIVDGAVHGTDPETGRDDVTTFGQEIGAPCPQRAAASGRRCGTGSPPGLVLAAPSRPLAPVEADRPTSRTNDGTCDRNGRFWASTMAFDATPGAGTSTATFGGDDLLDVSTPTASSLLTDEEREGQPLAGRLFRLRTEVGGARPVPFAG